jgi:FMN phosphatase YigB (HAD superfamily)
MAVRILSDFDGVWTDQAREAEHVKAFQREEAARLAGVALDEARADFSAYAAAVLNEPHRFGWTPDGRITAYADEDPFCQPGSIAGWIEARAARDARAALYRTAILRAGYPSLTAFSDHCFVTAASAYRSACAPALVDGAQAAFRALREAGAEVVVVSNSPAEKVVDWLRHAGLDAGRSSGHLVRVHGDAGKWHVAGDDAIDVGGRRVLVDRPRYRALIEEEQPDLVIGDVFSLDLALPHALRAAGHPAAPDLLALRRHPHTPDWVLDTLGDGAIDVVVDHVRDLVTVVRELGAQR